MSGSAVDPVTELAAGQHGVVTRRQLLALGLTSRQVERRLNSGRLHRMHRGVYLIGSLRGNLKPPRAAEMAAVLACGPGALLSHLHGASLWDLAPTPPRSAPVHVLVPGDRTPTRRPGITGHRATDLAPSDCSVVDGIPVTSPTRTISDFAALATSRALERAVARAVRLGLVSEEELRERASRAGRRPGARMLRAVLHREGGPKLTRSEAEARFLDLIRGTGLPRPEINFLAHGYELDFFWPQQDLAVEVDGFAYHGSRRRFIADRRRDADLFSTAGIRVLRFTWGQIVDESKATLVTLTRALHRA